MIQQFLWLVFFWLLYLVSWAPIFAQDSTIDTRAQTIVSIIEQKSLTNQDKIIKGLTRIQTSAQISTTTRQLIKKVIALYVSPSRLAQCLSSNWRVMFGTERCPHCKDQRQLFGSSFEQIQYIDCDQEKSLCREHNIQAYPTRMDLGGNMYVWIQSIQELKHKSECFGSTISNIAMKTHLSQLWAALSIYQSDYGLFPVYSWAVSWLTTLLSDYMQTVPTWYLGVDYYYVPLFKNWKPNQWFALIAPLVVKQWESVPWCSLQASSIQDVVQKIQQWSSIEVATDTTQKNNNCVAGSSSLSFYIYLM